VSSTSIDKQKVVILSAAKDLLSLGMASASIEKKQILRCAQDDRDCVANE
jgi:hypothetical protein